ncbi:hypothetical protein E3Q22_00888 [Wallemia mellicola]|uniref:Uncharacterized protein n=1 Tax=Wallemia mellicola TaxID=1708541 RepID=A0A4T0P421_9BASI|nr:hypothetical protein E3Q24_00830 [Wallemia mellicola]TIB78018.1 hypothetical protein E3Q23_00995 [Wallemia mellicola]TIB81636.1 hypothetical protein E3Q22_00888 [Wallemia mellicola]TIB91016.1 hypothetical protein E3Q21_00062 [Wallemia mellicola]TIB92791.1 hypothetical protein E3Q20_00063 [Wallemia mellicola]
MLGGTISLALCDTIVRNTLIKGLRSRSLDETKIDEITTDPTSIGMIEGINTSEVLQTYCNGIRNVFILFTACSGASFLISLLIKQCECTQAVIADGMMNQLERPDDKVLKEEGKAWAEEHKAKKRAKKGADVGNNST